MVLKFLVKLIGEKDYGDINVGVNSVLRQNEIIYGVSIYREDKRFKIELLEILIFIVLEGEDELVEEIVKVQLKRWEKIQVSVGF